MRTKAKEFSNGVPSIESAGHMSQANGMVLSTTAVVVHNGQILENSSSRLQDGVLVNFPVFDEVAAAEWMASRLLRSS